MRKEIRFVADDGMLFESESACQAYEAFDTKIKDAESSLPPVKLEDGQCVQLDRGAVLAYQRVLVGLFMEAHSNLIDNAHVQWAFNAQVPAGQTLIGRYMDDCGPARLYAAWWRIMCIDKNFRQWSQPYYAALSDRGSR